MLPSGRMRLAGAQKEIGLAASQGATVKARASAGTDSNDPRSFPPTCVSPGREAASQQAGRCTVTSRPPKPSQARAGANTYANW